MMVIVSALKSEIAPFLDHYSAIKKIPIGSGSLYTSEAGHFLRTGIGPELGSQNLALYLKEYQPGKIINIGLAGNLNPDYKVGQFFWIEQVIDEISGNFIQLSAFKKKQLIESARLVTVHQAVMDVKKSESLRQKNGADLVDMEAYPLAKISALANIPFYSFKIISDHADRNAEKIFLEYYKTLCLQLFDKMNSLLNE